MAFRFKLKGVLKLREEEERQAQMELGRLKQEEFRMQEIIRETEKERSSWINTYNGRAKDQGSEQDLILIEQYLISLEGRQRFYEGEVVKLQSAIMAAVKAVEIAYRARRQVEVIRDKQKEQYDLEMKTKELREMNEMTILRHLYKQNQENESK